MSDPFLGEIKMFGGNFAPRGYALCDGQLLPISQNSALFSLLGTTYGGDGRTTFGLPDLRGRFAIHAGSGPGLPTYRLGQKAGAPTRTLTTSQLPDHTHTGRIKASGDAANTNNPSNNALALAEAYSDQALSGASPLTKQGTVQIDSSGGGQSYDTMPPYTAVNFIIALQGTFPSRN
jgi:microcystin-dependent protein